MSLAAAQRNARMRGGLDRKANECIYYIFKSCEASGDDPEKVVERIVTEVKTKLLGRKEAQRATKLAEFEKLKKELGL